MSGRLDGSSPLRGAEAPRPVAYLDRTLWSRLQAARTPAEAAEYWLALQCRMIDGVARASVLVHTGDGLSALASWPERDAEPAAMLEAAERAVAEGKGVVSGHREHALAARGLCRVAYPFGDGSPPGAVAIEVEDRGEDELRSLVRQLQWGVAQIELSFARQRLGEVERAASRTGAALDLIGAALDAQGYDAACKAVVTGLATRLGCDLVALGLARGQRHEVVALSHSAQVGRRMNLVQAMAAAMAEAVDQESVLAVPMPDGAPYQVTVAHQALSRALDDAVLLTVPLLEGERATGALVLQWPAGTVLDQDTVDVCDAAAAALAPILDEKRRNDRPALVYLRDAAATQAERLLGPGFPGRKVAAGAAILLVAVLTLVQGEHRITAPASIEGRVQRVVVAPFDGYIATQAARAGDRVSAGAPLATLDRRDLALEHLRWSTIRQQRLAEFDQALANRDRTGINVVKAQIRQADAHIALFEEQLARTELTAAFDAIVVSGDLSQSVGAAVKRGEELFRIAPLDRYRIILEVDEAEVSSVKPGQAGQLRIASLLDAPLGYTVEQVTPITESRDGRSFFRVEAVLEGSGEGLRPGMRGIAKTEVGSRSLVGIWAGDLVDWLRLKLWAWWP